MQFFIVLFGIWILSFLLYALIDVFVIAIYIIWSLSLSKVFSKIGVESWKAYIPGYNIYILIKAAGLPIYYMIGCIVPIFGRIGFISFYIFIIYISVMLAKKFRKKQKFLLNIMIAPPLYMFELGKDNSRYEGDYKER